MFLQITLTTFLAFVKLVQTQSCSPSNELTASDSFSIFSILQNSLNLNPINFWDGPITISGAPTLISTTSFTEAELRYYNWFAASVYCPYTLSDLSCCYCGQFNSTVTSHAIYENNLYGTKAMVSLHLSRNEIVVTFRGTVAIMNVLMDVLLIPVSSSGVKVHRGFYLSTMSLYNEIVQEVGRHLDANPTFRVVATGHSLGGAMASLFLYFATSLNQFPSATGNYALVTFGQPRTGNRAYADYMNALNVPMARVVSRGDIIPHAVPVSALGVLPLLLGFYYVHHGQEVWINGVPEVIQFCSRSRYEDPNCSNSLGPLYSVLDHVQYFEADYAICYFVEGWLNIDLLTLPIGIQPTDILPPMPQGLQRTLGGVVGNVHRNLISVL